MNTQCRKHGTARRKKQGLQRLAPEDRRLYESICDGLDYVDHPSFEEKTTARDLWGAEREEINVPQYSLFPDENGSLPASRRTIDKQQERILFLRYNYAKYRACQLLEKQRKYFSSKRARKILRWYRKAVSVREKIVHANLALVPSMISRKNISVVDFTDLMSEGYMAVLRSVERFDVSRGYKFSTYACRSILSAFQYLGKKAQKQRNRFPTEFDPNYEESDYTERRHENQRSRSIEAIREVLRGNRANLSDIEHHIIQQRFPMLDGEKPSTLSQVGDMVGLTNERVRQIEQRSLAKIRTAFEETCTA